MSEINKPRQIFNLNSVPIQNLEDNLTNMMQLKFRNVYPNIVTHFNHWQPQ